MSNTPTRATIYEDSGITCMARILSDTALKISISTTSAITVAVFKNGGTSATYTASLVVANVVFDDYQTDARWSADSTGYNFRTELPALVFDEGDATYRVEYKFTPTSGAQYWVIYSIDTVEVLTS